MIAPTHVRPCLRLIAGSILLALCASGQGAVVCSPMTDLDLPATTEGLYVNLVTAVSGTSEGAVPGFDFDPYAAASTNPAGQLKFYWGAESSGGAGVASTGTTYAVLGPGVSIGADNLFTRAAFTGDTTAWQAGTTGYLGTRFRDETTGLLLYGWLSLSTTSPLGFPATLHGWCYEDSGAAIVTPDPPPSDRIFTDGFENP